MDAAEKIELLRKTLVFKNLASEQIADIAGMAFSRQYSKGDIIFNQSDECEFFYVVANGLVKVSICSPSGIKITYLLAGKGEPLNLVGPFTGSPRFIIAEAFENASVLSVKREDFLSYVFKYPPVLTNIIGILGHAIDSANGRIIDMMEKKVEQRILKVLNTLQKKFGSELNFTSNDLAELGGTTTESALRAMSRLRDMGIIKTERGKITILDKERLMEIGYETFWV